MVLPKDAQGTNAEGQNIARDNTNKWPSVSTINRANLDASSTTILNQSCTTSTENLSTSANTRNIMLNKRQFYRQNKIPFATSSERQFPVRKDHANDSAMMPPPSTPGVDFGHLKKFNRENNCHPVFNTETSKDKNDNGLSSSVFTNSIVDSPKTTGSISTTSNNITIGKVKSNSRSTERKERIFHKWRVLLNDQGQLIINGTLECGKVARSKPVGKRLTCTSVQSIYKCIYHLVGNLVDKHQQLPDYVSGKFYNGFPVDWDNVLQVWRSYVSNGHRLSFRWPTPVTDSDDGLSSDVEDISSRLPRKRRKTLKTRKPLGNVSQSSSKNPHDKESLKVSANDKTETSHEMCNVSLVTSEITNGTSLRDIIQENYLKIIIDNLRNKNCSIDYIIKMAAMLDSMKYVLSHQWMDTDGSDKNDRSNSMNQSSRTPDKQGPVMEDENNRGSPLQYCPVNSVRSRNSSRDISDDNRKADSQNIAENLGKVQHTSKVRRKLSDTDYHEDMRKTINSHSSSYEINNRSCQGCKDCKILNTAMTSKMQFHCAKRPLDGSYEPEKHVKNYSARKKKYDSRFTDESLEIEETCDPKEVCGGEFVNPRTCRGNKGRMENFRRKECNSTCTITEDVEGSYRDTTKVKETKGEQYDSDIRIIEDEHGDTRNGGNKENGKCRDKNENDKNLVKMKSNRNHRSETTSPSVDTINNLNGKTLARVVPERTENSKFSNEKSTIKEMNALDVDTLDYEVPTCEKNSHKLLRTSSRGRRILPSLTYWAGERLSTKGGKAIYDPGNCEEHSLPSLLDISSQETMNRKKSRNTHLSPSAGAHKVDGNRTEDTSVSATKKKDMVKVSSLISCIPITKKTEQSGRPRGTSTIRNRPRTRLIEISNEFEDSKTEETTRILRKRQKKRDSEENASTMILRSANRVTPLFETLEASVYPQLGSSKDSGDYGIQQKLRKRLKTVENER